MQLEGSLQQFPLSELLAMVVGSSVTGVLELAFDHSTGLIFSGDGHLYHATVGDLDGFDAVCRMFAERDAHFRFIAGQTSDRETLHLDSWDLIEEGERQAKAWEQVRHVVRSVDWVPVLRTGAVPQQIAISERAWPVLSAIDGQRNIAAIASELGYVPVEVALMLCELLEQNLIVLNPPTVVRRQLFPSFSPQAYSEPEVPAVPAGRSRGNFFERLLTKAPPTF
ncbi:MAG: hypothetical protein OHK0022_30290 [Roseiflexaceae bacterium]